MQDYEIYERNYAEAESKPRVPYNKIPVEQVAVLPQRRREEEEGEIEGDNSDSERTSREELKKQYINMGFTEKQAEKLVKIAEGKIKSKGKSVEVASLNPFKWLGIGGKDKAENKGKDIYEVKKGDTLSKIAKANGMSLEELLELNPQLKQNPDLIHPGDEIKLKAEERSVLERGKEIIGNLAEKVGRKVTNAIDGVVDWAKEVFSRDNEKREEFLRIMTEEVLGKPYPTDADYRNGEGKGPNKFDCSGGITWTLKQMGYDIEPWNVNANNLATNSGYTEPVSRGELQSADLIFWDWDNDNYIGIM